MSVTLDASNTMIGTANGAGLLIAPVGTAPPADTTTAWGVGWETIGYVHEDGVTLALETENESLKAWQSKTALRTVITGRELTVEFTMLEVTPKAMALFFDEDPPSGDADAFSLTVTSEGSANDYAVGIDTKDGDNVLRYIFPRATLAENGEISLVTSDFQGFPVTLSAQDQNGVLATIIKGPAVAGGGAFAVGRTLPDPDSQTEPPKEAAPKTASKAKAGAAA